MSDLHERIEGAIETLGSNQHCLTCRNTQVSKPPDGRLVVWCTEKKTATRIPARIAVEAASRKTNGIGELV